MLNLDLLSVICFRKASTISDMFQVFRNPPYKTGIATNTVLRLEPSLLHFMQHYCPKELLKNFVTTCPPREKSLYTSHLRDTLQISVRNFGVKPRISVVSSCHSHFVHFHSDISAEADMMLEEISATTCNLIPVTNSFWKNAEVVPVTGRVMKDPF